MPKVSADLLYCDNVLMHIRPYLRPVTRNYYSLATEERLMRDDALGAPDPLQSTINPFRISTQAQEGNLQVSKWLHIQVLLSSAEMHRLLEQIEEKLKKIYFVAAGQIGTVQQLMIDRTLFEKRYHAYTDALAQGELPDPKLLNAQFSLALSLSLDNFYAIEVASGGLLAKAIKPVVQMQSHFMGFSVVDMRLRPMVRSNESIPWGVQISYPLIYQDPKTSQVHQALREESFTSRLIFQEIQKWMRIHTRATPFIYKDKRMNVPMRLGHDCFHWVNNHPMLQYHGLIVDSEGEDE